MLRLNSVVLIASGVGLLTYSYGQPQSDAVRQLEDVTRIATRIVLNYDRQAAAPAAGLDSDAHDAGNFEDAPAGPDATGAVVANAARPPVSTWTTVVRSADIETPVVRAPDGATDKVRIGSTTAPFVVAALPVRRPTTPQPDTTTSRDARAYALVSDIQKHLKRTNCYGGPVSGQWTPATQEAMEAFLAVANAALPVQKPDSVLLALVKSHTGTSCEPAWRTSVERARHARAEPPAAAPKAPSVYVTAAAEPSGSAARPVAARSRPAGMMGVGAPPPSESAVAERARAERAHAEERAAVARRERTRAIALLVEPIEPDADEAHGGTRMIPPPIPRGDIEDAGDARDVRAKPRNRSTPAATGTRQVTAALSDDGDAFEDFSTLSRPLANRQGQTRKQKRRQARAKRNRPDWQRRGPPSYAQYKPRRRTWLPRGSVRYQIHQAISGLY